MKKNIGFVFLIIISLFSFVACSEKEWSYRYEGTTENWHGVTEIIPDQENGARFIGKIKYLGDKKVNTIRFVSNLTQTSEQTGHVQNPDFKDGYLTIFQDVPNSESTKNEFKNGVTPEEITLFFGEYPVYKITWTDVEGIENTEIINLKYADQE
ncbi:hypothetical protein [Brevibacillus gelatini]|uniref:Lipoprotein n=1 Tax=Brevibacillus gelatini TaxID=1655277 RepID=A0A3M8BBP7_9BACL|nr:hypothetical protein [Brevibacillus gelatini]RNB60800.1 hypothetical protein EDM57_02690 [Brevibacillus gelatini]